MKANELVRAFARAKVAYGAHADATEVFNDNVEGWNATIDAARSDAQDALDGVTHAAGDVESELSTIKRGIAAMITYFTANAIGIDQDNPFADMASFRLAVSHRVMDETIDEATAAAEEIRDSYRFLAGLDSPEDASGIDTDTDGEIEQISVDRFDHPAEALADLEDVFLRLARRHARIVEARAHEARVDASILARRASVPDGALLPDPAARLAEIATLLATLQAEVASLQQVEAIVTTITG